MIDEPFDKSVPDVAGEPVADQMHLWHIFLWITCCSVVLALVRLLIERHPEKSLEAIPMMLVFASLLGTVVMGLILAVEHWYRGQRLEPGHWLMAAQGAAGILLLVIMLIDDPSANRYLSILLPSVMLIAVMSAALRDRLMAKRWRVAFRIVLGINCLQMLYTVGLLWSPSILFEYDRHIFLLFIGVTLLWWVPIAVVGVWDRIKKRRYGWLHRVGVATAILSGIAGFLGISLG